MFVGAHIRTETINLWSDKTFLGQFHGVSSRDSFELSLRVLFGVNLNTAFGATEGHISDLQLESHERGKGHTLLNVDVRSVSSAALDWQMVVLVLGSVANDILDLAVVSANGDRETDDSIAGHDHIKVVLRDASFISSALEKHLNLLEETRFGNLALGHWLGGSERTQG